MTRRMVGVALILLVAGCTPPDTRAQDEAAIRAVESAWSAAMQARDVDKFLATYTPDAVVMPPNQPMLTTPSDIRKSMSGLFNEQNLNMSFKPTGLSVAKSGELGYSYGTYDMSFTLPSGNPFHDKGKYATVWKKQADGSWKAAVDIFNTDSPVPLPPPPTPPPPPVVKGGGK